ncbi:MAG: hypothetical protein BWY64_01770 [bacterium ADurb.Bin363]|nr:MAG: hypothetical protein BWY64_01770 [bacterium ADurb.Bin363]
MSIEPFMAPFAPPIKVLGIIRVNLKASLPISPKVPLISTLSFVSSSFFSNLEVWGNLCCGTLMLPIVDIDFYLLTLCSILIILEREICVYSEMLKNCKLY